MAKKHIITLEFDEDEFNERVMGIFWKSNHHGYATTPLEFVKAILDNANFNSSYYIKDFTIEDVVCPGCGGTGTVLVLNFESDDPIRPCPICSGDDQ